MTPQPDRRGHPELWIASFATYKADEVLDALSRATHRGVHLHLILESKEESNRGLSFDQLGVFRSHCPTNTTVYTWPDHRRPRGKGVLHMKCAISDRRRVFVTSANLTDHALHENMELGLLIHGDLGERLVRHFEALVEAGDLERQA